LQHDLGDPDAVGRFVLLPGERGSTVLVKPGQKSL